MTTCLIPLDTYRPAVNDETMTVTVTTPGAPLERRLCASGGVGAGLAAELT